MEQKIIVKSYKEMRLEYFTSELTKANKKLERHVEKMANGKLNAYDYGVQDKASDLGMVVSFLEDAVSLMANDE